MTISLSTRIKREAPQLKLLVTEFDFRFEQNQPEIWTDLLAPLINQIRKNDKIDRIQLHSAIRAAKATYKHFGKDPARFRPSSESLWRRIVQQKGLYQINALVDLNNYFSLLYKLPFGVYDLTKLALPIELTVGSAGLSYTGIGKGEINLEGALVLRDQLGCFGGPTSDSSRGMISNTTKRGLMIGYSFDNDPEQLAIIQKDILQKIPIYLSQGTCLNQYII